MRTAKVHSCLWILFVSILLVAPIASTQTDTGASYKTEREQAAKLYADHKYLDALPVFEDLASKNPKDDQVLVGLAACLVNHAATLSDAEAAGKERVRAKDLLVTAQSLGNKSDLLLNLLQQLQALPGSGQMKFSESTAADDAMRTGEAAFARRDFDEAIRSYSKALELDPKNAAAALFVGDSYFSKNDFANAGEWYGRASQVNPNLETPYRYYADMLIKSGQMDEARSKAIKAIVAEPYNPATWRELVTWANANHVQLVRVHVNIPGDVSRQNGALKVTIPSGQSTQQTAAWTAYNMSRVLWQNEKFKKQFPNEAQYRHSLAEESASLSLAAQVWTRPLSSKTPPQADPDLDLLAKIYAAGLVEPYVLMNAADQGIAQDYAAYRETNRARLEQYLSEFVVPATPSKPQP